MIRSRALVALAGAVLVCLSWAAERDAHAQPKPSSGDLRVLPIRGNIYLIAGAGANVVASVGKDGVLLVDTGPAQMADKVLETVRALSRMVTASPTPMKSCVGVAQGCRWWSSSELLPTTAAPRAPRPIIGIINTSDDPDHLGGNAVLSAAGRAYAPTHPVDRVAPLEGRVFAGQRGVDGAGGRVAAASELVDLGAEVDRLRLVEPDRDHVEPGTDREVLVEAIGHCAAHDEVRLPPVDHVITGGARLAFGDLGPGRTVEHRDGKAQSEAKAAQREVADQSEGNARAGHAERR